MSGACLGTGWRERCEGRKGAGHIRSVDGCGPFAVSTALIFYTCGGAVRREVRAPPRAPLQIFHAERGRAAQRCLVSRGKSVFVPGKECLRMRTSRGPFFMHILDGSRSFFIFTYRRFKPPDDTDRQPNHDGAAGHSVTF